MLQKISGEIECKAHCREYGEARLWWWGKHIHCFLSPGTVKYFLLACGLLIWQGKGLSGGG